MPLVCADQAAADVNANADDDQQAQEHSRLLTALLLDNDARRTWRRRPKRVPAPTEVDPEPPTAALRKLQLSDTIETSGWTFDTP